MSNTILSVKHLVSMLRADKQSYALVDDVSFNLQKGKTLALLGESGCGKSMTALSLLGLTPQPAVYLKSGSVLLEGEDLLTFSEQQMRTVRGKKISMIFQEPMTSLNPVMTVGEQIAEVLLQNDSSKSSLKQDIIDLMAAVGIPDAQQRLNDYPHQFSGGMKQRVMIALALGSKPDVLIADEPSTALDVTIQAQVLDLIKDMQKQRGMAILLITHDLAVVRQMADDIAIMYAGQIVETAPCDAFFKQPMHPYSRALFEAIPSLSKRNDDLSVIKGLVPSLQQNFSQCRFINRCDFVAAGCHDLIQLKQMDKRRSMRCIKENFANKTQANKTQANEIKVSEMKISDSKQAAKLLPFKNNATPIIEVNHLKTYFPIRKGLLKSIKAYVYAVDDVSFSIQKGETLALVGESGCGKTSVGKSILKMLKEAECGLKFNAKEVRLNSTRAKKEFHQKTQFIFQDPFSSMNPRMTIKQIMAEGLLNFTALKGDDLDKKIAQLLLQVGLESAAMERYPHEFSGGQRQRICIARALAVEPEFIVCDEPTSALDVSVQAQILNLLKQLQQTHQIAYLFITHDLSVVSWLADKVAVMYLGRIVEYGTVEQILNHAKHPYTQALLKAVPSIAAINKRHSDLLSGELPSPINPPKGCYFHPRCCQAMPQCQQSYPESAEIDGHQVSCFRSGIQQQ